MDDTEPMVCTSKWIVNSWLTKMGSVLIKCRTIQTLKYFLFSWFFLFFVFCFVMKKHIYMGQNIDTDFYQYNVWVRERGGCSKAFYGNLNFQVHGGGGRDLARMLHVQYITFTIMITC